MRESMEFFSGMLSLLHSSLSTVLKASFELWRKSDDIGLDSRLPVPQSYSRRYNEWATIFWVICIKL